MIPAIAPGRENVLSAARTEFAARGYAATSVRDIVARAGVTAPTLYHHFGSKAGVYGAVVDEVNDRVIPQFERVVAGKPTYAERLVAIVEVSREVQRQEPDIAQFVLSSQQDVARHKELAGVKPAMSRLATFAESVADGSPPAGMTEVQAGRVVLTLIFGLARLAVVESPREYALTTEAVIGLIRGGVV